VPTSLSFEDMAGIDPEIACHRLNIREGATTIRQKPRPMAPEKAAAVNAEVDKLLRAGLIRESQYPDWICQRSGRPREVGSGPCLHRLHQPQPGMSKRQLPPTRIDTLVDSTARHEMLFFIDGYSGYHKIPMHLVDQEHTTFVTDRGLFCYRMMLF